MAKSSARALKSDAAPAGKPDLPEIFRDTIVGTVRADSPDISARQLAILLVTLLEPGPHTVRGLALRLQMSKPAITRSIDRLEQLDLARRLPDPRDRRSILVGQSRPGIAYVAALKRLMMAAAKV